jgi:hypothetical protein
MGTWISKIRTSATIKNIFLRHAHVYQTLRVDVFPHGLMVLSGTDSNPENIQVKSGSGC